MPTPKISIVTPSFNQGKFLEATINSVLSQNYPNLEYIIIDGGSTDHSVDIIKKYKDYLHYWCSEPDQGQYDAINKGFSYATGDILAWLNSDDVYCPWSFRTIGDIMSEFLEVEWITTLSPGGLDWHGFCSGFGYIPGFSKEAFLDSCYLPNPNFFLGFIQQESTFWRRSLWEKVGSKLNLEFELAADFDLWARFFEYADLYGVKSPLSFFRGHEDQKSRQKRKQYMIEANKSLSIAREQNNWTPNHLRNLALKAKLNRIPRVKVFISKKNGYIGKKIVREKPSSSQGYWSIKEYKFLYFF